jgi:hypothetical protein
MREPFDPSKLFYKTKMYKIYSVTLELYSKGGADAANFSKRYSANPNDPTLKYAMSAWNKSGKTWNSKSALHAHLAQFNKIPDDWRVIEISANGFYQMTVHDEWPERFDIDGNMIQKTPRLF